MNLPNEGNVTNLADGAVVEIMGVADGAGVRGRDTTTVPGIMGEFLRRINVVQEWTVEAALTGDRDARARSDAGRPDGGAARVRRHRRR